MTTTSGKRAPMVLEQMEAVGKKLAAARLAERRVRNEAKFLLRKALELEESIRPRERRMSRALGVSRETVRAWTVEIQTQIRAENRERFGQAPPQ